MKYKPYGERCLLEVADEKPDMVGGIAIPEISRIKQGKPDWRIVAMGTQPEEHGLKVGDIVLCDVVVGEVLVIEGKKYRLVPYSGLLARVGK